MKESASFASRVSVRNSFTIIAKSAQGPIIEDVIRMEEGEKILKLDLVAEGTESVSSVMIRKRIKRLQF